MAELENFIARLPSDGLLGRRQIFTDKKEVTPENIVEVVGKGFATHLSNRAEIQYLYDYYRGKQDIREKTKVVRPEINNKVTVNIANEIVTFKTAYFMSGPIQYASNGGEDSISEKVNRLNEFMRAEDKASKDKEIVDWFHICGVAPRMVLSDPEGQEDGSPACIYTLDPREAFVIYYSGYDKRSMVGVLRQKDENGDWFSCAYTKDRYYEIKGEKITNGDGQGVPHSYGMVPIIEYLNNNARMGTFEVVLSVLNTINTLESNRVDNVQDFVNAYDVFQNCEIATEAYQKLASGGQAIQIKTNVPGMESKVYRITSELNQTGAQTEVDNLTDRYITICGMPNRNGGSSTSDTGAGVQFRDGWVEADSRANDTEQMFNRAEREFLRLFLRICRDTADLDLKLSDIKIEHTRNNLSNMQSRMQILCEGLNNDKIHPKIPWVLSGMPNAEEYYRISMEHYNEEQAKLAQTLKEEIKDGEESIPDSGQSAGTVEQESDTAV